MAKFNYAKLQKKAAKVIDRFGAGVTARRPAYTERVNGAEIDHPAATYNIVGVKYDYKPFEIDGTRILAGDCKFVLSGAADVRTGDIIPIDGKDHRVVNPELVKPAAVNVLYVLQMRA